MTSSTVRFFGILEQELAPLLLVRVQPCHEARAGQSSASNATDIGDLGMSNEANVVVDPSLCIGAGLCEEVDPDVFELDDLGISQVIASNAPPLERVAKAIESCPSGAISWAKSAGPASDE